MRCYSSRHWVGSALGVLLLLTGCSAGKLQFAATDFKVTEYRHKSLAVLPLVYNPALHDVSGVPAEELRKKIVDALKERYLWQGLKLVGPADVDTKKVALEFPLTPQRLALLAGQFDGAVGISVISWRQLPHKRGASIDLMISFADSRTPLQQRFVLVSSWSGDDPDDLVEQVEIGLPGPLLDLRYLAWRGSRPSNGKVSGPNQPLVTLQSTQFPKLASGYLLTDKRVSLDVTGVFDGGVASLSLSNSQGSYSEVIAGTRSKSGQGVYEYPIYMNAPFYVPLRFGKNRLLVTAASPRKDTMGRDIVGTNEITLNCITPPRIHVLAVGNDSYEDTNLAPTEGTVAAAHRVIDAVKGLHHVGDAKVLGNITNEKAMAALDSIYRVAGADDQVLVTFSGRIRLSDTSYGREPFILIDMHNTRSDFPELTSLSLAYLTNLAEKRAIPLLLDLCFDVDPGNEFRDMMKAELGAGTLATLRPCSEAAAPLLGRAADWFQGQRSSRELPAIKDLLADLRGNVAEVIAQ